MNYWIFTALSPKEDGLTAREVYDTRMRDKFWGFEKTARNLKNLQPGDKVIYYVGRPDMVFAGSATLASTAFKLSEAQKENYSHGISFYRVNLYGVLIEDIDWWSSPKPVKTIKQELKFIENKDNWGFYLRGSVRKIDEQDYRTIINFQRRDRTNINVQEVTPVAINGAKKILNIILRKRDQLKQGNYIRKADPKEDYLFDFFVNKLKKYKYSRKFGVNFNLIIAGSETKENDFFIIPYSSISHMLRRKYTSTHKNKSKRWVGSIKHNQLRINNCPETLNVVQFYGNLNYLRQPQTQGLEYQEVEKSRGDWYKYEVEETVKDYFEMLSAELGGEHYNKTEHRKALLAKLKKRSEVAIEFKHQNISAALIAKGLPYIEEYIPLGNYQSILDDAIDNY